MQKAQIGSKEAHKGGSVFHVRCERWAVYGPQIVWPEWDLCGPPVSVGPGTGVKRGALVVSITCGGEPVSNHNNGPF